MCQPDEIPQPRDTDLDLTIGSDEFALSLLLAKIVPLRRVQLAN